MTNILVNSFVFPTIGTLMQRATRKLNYEQDRYVRIYREVERQEIQDAFAVSLISVNCSYIFDPWFVH